MSATGRCTAGGAGGTVVAANPIAYLIPCHRVIRANAEFGEYRWGQATKRALIGLELARSEGEVSTGLAASSAFAFNQS
ncbi:methylated-DNA--[protein]-cysteine S-methyltransferase [Roseateles sp. GG27B]